MFIELTDHLRCPAEHDEAFLVLLPDLVEGRSVRTGTLGCPLCDRRFTLRDGVFDAGGAPPAAALSPGGGPLGPDALAPLVGLGGPGGYLVLVGPPAAGWREMAELVPGVGLVAVNPPAGVVDEDGLSVLRGGRLPLRPTRCAASCSDGHSAATPDGSPRRRAWYCRGCGWWGRGPCRRRRRST